MPLVLLTRRGNSGKKMFWKRLQEAFFFFFDCLFIFKRAGEMQ